ncbi:MAG: sialate O-acetylesterase [Arachidicoccus sp.]|nr:sialate O-acetylesterase [Arachidicoccus sp.]
MLRLFKALILLILLTGCISDIHATSFRKNYSYKNLITNNDTNKIDTNFHLFLLIGQSNMAGRAPLDTLDIKTDSNILMLDKQNQWVIAKDPLHFDKPSVAGVGPGISFAHALLKHLPKGARIGLIPCAWGGSPISVWQPDSTYLHHKPYNEAIERTKIATQSGVLSGILWHQGESNNNPAKAAKYLTEISTLVSRLRNELQSPQVPFVAGETGYFQNPNYINPVIDSIPSVISNSAVVSAKGLHDKGDKTHFDTPSARELGKRYSTAMEKLLDNK